MRGKYEFREPLMMDEHGLYITVAQMHFFLNRPKGKAKFKTADAEFLSYYKNCCLYNLVYDMMEDNPKCAKVFWDSDAGCVSLSFPVRGHVAMALAQVSHIFKAEEEEYDDDEDEDIYGIFS
jgi:hypothetical protein